MHANKNTLQENFNLDPIMVIYGQMDQRVRSLQRVTPEANMSV